jgi:hypothetical protein
MRRKHARPIIMCSTETFRMYNALCTENSGQKKKRTGKREWVFSSRTPAFFLAAAIGIVNDKTVEGKKEKQLTRREYIVNHRCFEAFSQLIKSKFNLKTEQETIDKLVGFQEAGIRELHDEYHKTGKIDFLRIYRDVKSRL